MKICPKCGAQKRDSEKFCDQCGSLLEVKNEAPVDIGATVYVSPLPDEEKTPAPAPQVAQPAAAPAPTPAPAPAPVAQPAPAKAPQPYAQPPMQPQMTQPQQPMQQPQFQAPQAPAYPVYAQQSQMAQQRPQAPVQQYQAQPQMAQQQMVQQPQYRQAAPQPQYQQPMQQPQYQQPMQQAYAAPVQAPVQQPQYQPQPQPQFQQYSPSAFPQKKGVDVLAIIACLLAIFIFIAPFLKTYVAKARGMSGEAESQIYVVKQVIETLGDKVNSSLITQYRVLTLGFAVLIVVALAVWIPALIHACKGNNLKAWRFVTLTCIFALTANVCYMFAMKAYADAFNVVRDVRAVSLDPNAIFIVVLVLIVALLVTSIVKRSLMKKHPQSV